MEIINDGNNAEREQARKNWEKNYRSSKVFKGLVVMTIGALFLAKELGADLPQWLLSWKMLLIVVGLSIGIKHGFQRIGWIIPIIIGIAFMVQDFFPGFRISHLIWPIIIIIVGVIIIMKPRRRHRNHWRRHQQWNEWKKEYCAPADTEDYLEVNAVFGGVKKNIISKNFTGGEINAVFGGAEINMMQAEIHGKVVLEINQVFGGTKLIVPAHWEIQSELTAVLGSVEDKRPVVPKGINAGGDVLILKGSAVFGGIDIKSY